MTALSMRWADRNLVIYGQRIKALTERYPTVLPRIVNQVGNRAKTVVIRELRQQTGLPRDTIVRAIGFPTVARPGRLHYDMTTRGGNIRLKYLGAKETAAGVVAKPFGKATLYPGAFMRGGSFPDRVTVAQFNGHAMFRNGTGRHYTFARSGVFIPVEMTKGATEAAFHRVAAPLLKERVDAALNKLLP